MARVEFITSQYVFSHGREPRGRGHWAFAPFRDTLEVFWAHGSYAEAKKDAVRQARAKYGEKLTRLYVQP
jgi:hypothetical protein